MIIDQSLSHALEKARKLGNLDIVTEQVITRRYRPHDINNGCGLCPSFGCEECTCHPKATDIRKYTEQYHINNNNYKIHEAKTPYTESWSDSYTTKSTGVVYPIESGVGLSSVQDVVVNKGITDELCKGCSSWGRNGGCPPYTQSFASFGVGNVIWVYSKLYTNDMPVANGLVTKKGELNLYFLASRQDAILVSVLRNYLSILRQQYKYILGDGYCKGCVGFKSTCTVARGLSCSHPEKRTLSPEAVGVLLDKTLKKVFGFDTFWYYYPDKIAAPYLYRAMAVYGDDVGYNDLSKIKQLLKGKLPT